MVMASVINTDMVFYVLNFLQFSITEANIIVSFETEVITVFVTCSEVELKIV